MIDRKLQYIILEYTLQNETKTLAMYKIAINRF